MINFDSLTLKAQLEEIAPILEEARIQKVQQPTRKELILALRSQGKSYKFYITINPTYPHAALLSEEGMSLRHIKIPQMPPMFCMLLRKHMEGAKILEVRQPEHERIIEFYFDSYNELGEKISMVLAIELMGKHSNIILYNYDTNVILGCAHNISSEKSRERELAGTLPYIYPPKQDKRNLLDIIKEQFISIAQIIDLPFNIWLNKNLADVSLALANEICEHYDIETKKDNITSIPQEKISKIYDLLIDVLSLDTIKPSISKDGKIFSLISLGKNEKVYYESVNEVVDIYFGKHVYNHKLEKLRTSLLAIVKKEIKKISEKEKKLLKDSDSVDKAEKYRITADIIMANLYQIKPGDKKLLTINPYNNEEIEISIDETISPNDNAQKYYKLYNKAKNAYAFSQKMLNDVKQDLAYYETIIYSLNNVKTIQELEQIKEELIKSGLTKLNKGEKSQKVQSKKQKQEKIDLEQVDIDGFKVYIGKNNKQNDYIISKLSAHNDIWLHAQEIPGSHILIKLPPEDIQVSDDTIYKAAELAAKYSQAKGSSKIPVIYTRRKFIKKPPAAKPGYVIYKNEKTIIVG